MESVGGHLPDGVSVGMHFVDVLAYGDPSAIVVFAAIFGVESVNGAIVVCGLDFENDIGAQIVCKGIARGCCVGWVVEAADVAVVFLKGDGRSFSLGWRHA